MPFWDSYVDFVEWCLRELTSLTGNAGLAIIVFTVIVKTLLLPLTVKSIRSTAGMQELQPKLKELQKKYANDKQRLSQEMMALYQQYQINPAAGCLPLIIQIPIFFGVYFAISRISKEGGDFLWLHLNEADPYKILPIAAGLFQFIQTRMMRPANAPKVTDPQQQMMNTMTNFMPLLVVFFGWTFISGAVLYWLVQSIYSVAQQWLITGWGSLKNWVPQLEKFELPEHRRLGYRKLEAKEYDPNAEPKGFMAKMQKRAMAMEEQQRKAAAARGGTPPAGGTGGGKSAKTRGNVRNVSGGADDEDTPATSPGTTSRVMTGKPSAASKNRSRGDRTGR